MSGTVSHQVPFGARVSVQGARNLTLAGGSSAGLADSAGHVALAAAPPAQTA